MQRIRSMGRLGTISAIVALAVACTGTAFAVGEITGKDIKNRTIKQKDISKKTLKALKGKTGPQGAQGPAGAPGLNGKDGAQGPPGLLDTLVLNDSTIDNPGFMPDELPPGEDTELIAECPDGTRPVSGGYDVYTMELDEEGEPIWETASGDPTLVVGLDQYWFDFSEEDSDDQPDGWVVFVYNSGENAEGFVDYGAAVVHCARGLSTEFAEPPALAAAQRAGRTRGR